MMLRLDVLNHIVIRGHPRMVRLLRARKRRKPLLWGILACRVGQHG